MASPGPESYSLPTGLIASLVPLAMSRFKSHGSNTLRPGTGKRCSADQLQTWSPNDQGGQSAIIASTEFARQCGIRFALLGSGFRLPKVCYPEVEGQED